MGKNGDKGANRNITLELYKLKWNNPELTFKQLMLELYITKNMTQIEMGRLLQRSVGTIHNWLDSQGIPGKTQKWS